MKPAWFDSPRTVFTVGAALAVLAFLIDYFFASIASLQQQLGPDAALWPFITFVVSIVQTFALPLGIGLVCVSIVQRSLLRFRLAGAGGDVDVDQADTVAQED